MQYLGAFFSGALYESSLIGAKIAVVEADRNFGSLGRVILNKVKEAVYRCVGTAKTNELPFFKGVCSSIKLKHDATLKVPLPLELKVDQPFEELLCLGILIPVKTGGAENCSPVWVKKREKLRMRADFKVLVSDKNNAEDYPLPCIETIFLKISGAMYFAKIDL